MTIHPTYVSFSQKLFTRLGIGANGDGAKALRLLARIQAGHQIPSVDGLYKSMVLETPATFTAADRAVEHFRKLEDLYGEMVTAAEKSRLLSRLPELWDERRHALATEQLIDTFGVTRPGSTPLLRWQLLIEQRLLETAVELNRDERRQVAARLATAKGQQRDLKLAVEQTKKDQREHGGDRLERLQLELDELVDQQQPAIQKRRNRFDERVAPLLLTINSEEDLFTAQLDAEEFLAGFPAGEAGLEAERRRLFEEGSPLTLRRGEIVKDLESLRGRNSLVPRSMHEARQAMAAATGLDEADLPFVAELIDLTPDQQDWRGAAEIALHAVARVMLVDIREHEHLSRVIEPIRMQHINFTGVDLAEHQDVRGVDGCISGRLIYKPSPFSSWVAERLTRNGTDALCVNGTEQLAGRELRITRSGQTRRGRDSAHGEFTTKPIIGFNNADLITQYEHEQSFTSPPNTARDAGP